MAPNIFNELMKQSSKIRKHPYKCELFSLGMVCLNAFDKSTSVQELYNIFEKRFMDEDFILIKNKLLKRTYN